MIPIVSESLALLFLIKLRCGTSVNTINYIATNYSEEGRRLLRSWWCKLPWYIIANCHDTYLKLPIQMLSNVLHFFSWLITYLHFPLLLLLPSVIKKISVRYIKNIVMITPAWSGLVYVQLLISMCISPPIFISSQLLLLGNIPTRRLFNLINGVANIYEWGRRAGFSETCCN